IQAPAWVAGRALTAVSRAEGGNRDGARIVVERFVEDGDRLPRDSFWVAALALLSSAATTAEVTNAYQSLIDLLEPYADQLAVFGAGGAVVGSVRHWLAELCFASGDDARAAEHFELAADVAERIDAPYWSIAAALGRAKVAFRNGTPRERQHAREVTAVSVD